MSQSPTLHKDLARANVAILRATGKYGNLRTAKDLEAYQQAHIGDAPSPDPKPFQMKPNGWCGLTAWQRVEGKNGTIRLFTTQHDGEAYLEVGNKPYTGEPTQFWRCTGCGQTFDTWEAIQKHPPADQH